jgi:glycosyltransferase involved in cell wall biosynthesis
MKPRVTVGICVRNCEDYIQEAITSIMDQDFPHNLMKLIVVDGYSEDKTLLILKENLNKTDLKYEIFYENEGLGRARQIVVDNSVAEYIVWVDGDMTISKDFVRTQVEFMDKNPDVGIAKGRYGLAPGANLIATLEIYSRAASKMVDFNAKDTSRFKSLGTSGCIYRVTAIRQAGGFDENIKGYGEDLDAEIRVKDAGWLLFMTDVTYRDYERHGLTARDLWIKYLRRGYDLHHFVHKNKGVVNLHKMLPPAAFLGGLFHSVTVYKLTHHKAAFLLPFQCGLKTVAWWLGFVRSHIVSGV